MKAQMTSRYAHIFDETLKNEFTKFQEKLVTNNGDVLDLDEDNEVDDVELQWFKKNINAQVLQMVIVGASSSRWLSTCNA